MNLPFTLIKVFNDPLLGFHGNTAAVVRLAAKMDASKMQELAANFNQPATSFLCPGQDPDHWYVRWFAPDGEIDLCGHGSLAAIAELGQEYPDQELVLRYPTGTINGQALDAQTGVIKIDSIPVEEKLEPAPLLSEGLGLPILGYFRTHNKHIVLVENEHQVKNMQPDFARLRQSKVFGFVVTAPGDTVDFVSRTIVPHVKQLEDPATGSSHALLTPFWAEQLGKTEMVAHQLSPRGGKFKCLLKEGMVALTGHFEIYARGEVGV